MTDKVDTGTVLIYWYYINIVSGNWVEVNPCIMNINT